MAEKIINVKHRQRHDTEANWTSKNPVLLDGEMGFVTGTQKYKVGDGTSKWSTLAYHTSLTDSEKTKLDGIAAGANKTTVDSALSSTSTNPVQNKVINTALSGKANTNHSHDLSAMINGLGEATATPSDDDYFVSQYAGGGTTNTSYFRRPVSALWNFIKSKLATVAISGSYNDLSNKPSIPSVGNGTVTIKQNGASKGSFTMNQSGSTTIELTDNNTNTWRDVVNNLESTATDKSLSAAQGKILNESKLMHKTINTSKTDFNSLTETGIYHITITDALNAPVSNHGTLYVDAIVGTKYQVFMGDTVTDRIFKRIYNDTNKTWTAWTTQKLTDTVYTHPNYTAKSSGFYKVTIDSTGHVSGTTAVTKGDITALGIPSTNTTYSTGTASTSGITKLYTGTGTATDGTMTQSAIKSALDGKSNTGHTHTKSQIADFPTSMPASDVYSWAKQSSKPSYSASEVGAVPTSRTVNGKALSSNITLSAGDVGAAASLHTHNYAGSGSAGGSANSAVKLATARTVSNTEDFVMSFSYDGSANSNANLRYYNSRISVGNTNNYPYHRFAKIDTLASLYSDRTSTFLITQDYNNGGWGIVRISLRTNNSSSVSTVEAKWLARCGLNVDCVQIGLYNVFGKTYADAFFKTSGTYAGTVIRNLASGTRGNISRTWILIDSVEANSTTTSDKKTSTESYVSTSAAATTLHSQAYTSVVVASDGGTVNYANSAGNASKVNNYTVNSNVPSGAKFTDTVYSHPTTSGNKHIPSGGSSGQILRWSADGTAVWGADNNTTYSDMKGATTSAAGTHGLVPAPANGAANRYLRSDGTWQVPPDNNTTYSNMTAATASAAGKAGLVPAPAAGKQGQFLRGDGTWATPADTNTWRGIQNNLTSTATDQSLSAYQGKLLNEKITNRILFQSSEPTTQSENDIWIKTTSL